MASTVSDHNLAEVFNKTDPNNGEFMVIIGYLKKTNRDLIPIELINDEDPSATPAPIGQKKTTKVFTFKKVTFEPTESTPTGTA